MNDTSIPRLSRSGNQGWGGRVRPGPACIWALLLGPWGPAALAQPQFTVESLGALAPNKSSRAYSVNLARQAAGHCTGNTTDNFDRPVLFEPGVGITVIGPFMGTPFPSQPYGFAYGINGSGAVTGYLPYYNSQFNAPQHAFRFEAGVLTDLNTNPNGTSRGIAINDSGQVVGWANIPFVGAFPTRWTGAAQTNIVYGAVGAGTGINAPGNISATVTMDTAGFFSTRAVYWNGTVNDLPVPGAATSNRRAEGLNDLGDVVGSHTDPVTGFTRACIWVGLVHSDLGSLAAGPTAFSHAFAINNNGWIIGSTTTPSSGFTPVPFLIAGGVMYALNSLTVPGSGWNVTEARGINQRGDIVGMGIHPVEGVKAVLLRVRCLADYNGDGFVDGIDADNFNNDFDAGAPRADYNGDGFVDGIDYDDFNNDFARGC